MAMAILCLGKSIDSVPCLVKSLLQYAMEADLKIKAQKYYKLVNEYQ